MTGTVADAEITQELPDRGRFVVYGDNSLAYRLAVELLEHRGEVIAIVRSRTGTYGALIAELAGVQVVETPRPYPFGDVDLTTVDALALVESNDIANLDAALVARKRNPELRMVIRMFNRSLGEGMAALPHCTVLSDGELAAPAFVAAALGGTASRVTVRNNTMYVAKKSDVPLPSEIICGLAVTAGPEAVDVLPADQDRADLVLARAEQPVVTAAPRVPRLTHRYPIRAFLGRMWRYVRRVLALFAGLVLLTAVILDAVSPKFGWWQAIYTAFLVALGGTDVDPTAPPREQVILVFLTIFSVLLLPILIGGVVDVVIKIRQDLAEGTVARPASDHVVVVGLGGIGSHVIQHLYDLGIDVVAIDRSADARGAELARALRIPLIIGDATRRETLLAASVPACRALMVITSDDVTNLETALIGRTLRQDRLGPLPVVLRLFDGEFAARVQEVFHLGTSRSVSYLAVPSFAASMLGRALDTVAVGRQVLLIAELEIQPHSKLTGGQTVRDLLRPGETWLLELTTVEGKRLPSTVARGRRLRYGERLLMVATRQGLAQLVAETTTPPDSEPRPPIVPFE